MAAGSVTQLLLAWRAGDEPALARLTPLVHDELQRIARRCLRGERAGHSLQATALVHEAYVRLIDARQVDWQNRAHFLAMAARLMRRVLVDAARRRGYQKRGGDAVRVSLTGALRAAEKSHDVVALDDALRTLASMDPRRSEVVELRFFGGLSVAPQPPDAWQPVAQPTTTGRPCGWSLDGRTMLMLLDTDGFRCLWGQRVGPGGADRRGVSGPPFSRRADGQRRTEHQPRQSGDGRGLSLRAHREHRQRLAAHAAGTLTASIQTYAAVLHARPG